MFRNDQVLSILITAATLVMVAGAGHAACAGEDLTVNPKGVNTDAAGTRASSSLKAQGEKTEKSSGSEVAADLPATAVCLGGPIADHSGDGRTVVVWFGDSNTLPDSLPGIPISSWCEQIVDLLPADWEMVCSKPFAMGLAPVVPTDDWVDALEQVQGALAHLEFDAAVLAYGTADLLRRSTPQEIVKAYRNVAEILCNARKSVYIATTPYVWPPEHPGNLRVDALNSTLADAFPYKALIDVTTGFDRDDYVPEDLFVHFSQRGQALRAQRAAARLLANSARYKQGSDWRSQ